MMEASYDDASNKLIATEHKLEEKEKLLGICEQDIFSLDRRVTLLESEALTAETRLGKMTIDLANICESAPETLTLSNPHVSAPAMLQFLEIMTVDVRLTHDTSPA